MVILSQAPTSVTRKGVFLSSLVPPIQNPEITCLKATSLFEIFSTENCSHSLILFASPSFYLSCFLNPIIPWLLQITPVPSVTMLSLESSNEGFRKIPSSGTRTQYCWLASGLFFQKTLDPVQQRYVDLLLIIVKKPLGSMVRTNSSPAHLLPTKEGEYPSVVSPPKYSPDTSCMKQNLDPLEPTTNTSLIFILSTRPTGLNFFLNRPTNFPFENIPTLCPFFGRTVNPECRFLRVSLPPERTSTLQVSQSSTPASSFQMIWFSPRQHRQVF